MERQSDDGRNKRTGERIADLFRKSRKTQLSPVKERQQDDRIDKLMNLCRS